MNSDTVRPALLVLLAVVALGVAAATIDSGQIRSGDGRPPPDRPGGGGGPLFGSGSGGDGFGCPTPLREPGGLAALVGVSLLAGAAERRLTDSSLLTAFVAVPLLLLVLVFCRPVAIAVPGLPNVAALLVSPGGFAAALLLAVAGALALAYVVAGGDAPADVAEAEAAPEVDLGVVGRAAGDAADRIERQADADNEVYRAWREMTTLLSVPNPRTATPGEFAAAAARAGMDRRHVDALTRLFEEVRYGGLDPAEREERAVAALREIEDAYAGVDRD